MNILELPDIVLEQILEYLSYDEIAKTRLVSSKLNKFCQNLLNRGFSKIIHRHANEMKRIKSMLPRRESERRHHPLIKHADILTCIETRISMLSMTYTKYIDMNICCFIPGKIIDEILNILKVVSDTTSTCKQLRVHEVLQELRDISSMAIDHFDEKIAHILKKSFCDLNAQKFGSSIYQILQSPIDNIQSDFGSTSYVRDTAKGNTKPANCKCEEAGSIRRSYLRLNKKYKTAMRKITRLESVQAKQMRMQRSYALSITQMNSQIVDLRRRLEESESKSRDIITNYNQLALLGQAAGNRNRITRNIKPRAATIILKRRINEQSAAEEKRRRTAE